MAMKDLVCQTCKKSILSVGYHHDEATLSLKCNNCSGLVFPTTKAEEDKNRATLRGSTTPNWTQKNELLPIKIAPATRACVNESQNFCG